MRKELKILLDTFDKTYVLTLEVAKGRQENVRKQLEGHNFDFFYGNNKSDFTIEQLVRDGIYDAEKAQSYWPDTVSISTGHIACSWGHREMYREIIEKKLQHTLILEDDIVVREHMIDSIPAMMQDIPKDADLIYWGYEAWWPWPEKNIGTQRVKDHLKLIAKKALGKKGFYFNYFPVTDHRTIEHLYIEPHNKHFSIAGAVYATHAYSINQKAAKVLLDLQTPISLGPDTLLYYAIMQGLIKAYIMVPMLFFQDRYTEAPTLENYIDYSK